MAPEAKPILTLRFAIKTAQKNFHVPKVDHFSMNHPVFPHLAAQIGFELEPFVCGDTKLPGISISWTAATIPTWVALSTGPPLKLLTRFGSVCFA